MIFRKRMLVVALLLLLLAPAAMAHADVTAPHSSITVPEETIHITDSQVTLTVIFESQTGTYNGTLEIWAPVGARLTCQGVDLNPTWNGSIATVDLAAYGLAIPAGENISIIARFSRDGDVVHHLLYDATVMVTVTSQAYVRGSIPLSFAQGSYTGMASLGKGHVVTISFAPAGRDDDVMLYLAAGLAMGALATGAALFLMYRQRRDRHLEKEPVEALEMRKKLLTQLLKQLETERDKGRIADAYYQSIKDYFKKDAMQVLREIDRRT